jgi:C-1 hydroxylase
MTVTEDKSREYVNIEEKNKATIVKFIESYNDRNLDIFDDLVAPDYVDHTHQTEGKDDFKRLFTMAFGGFPDWYEEIQEIIAEGDRVWVRVIATGTHSGNWNLFGIPLPPTGRKVQMEMVFIWRIVNGKLVEGREVDDSVDFLKQLGLLEYTEEGNKVFSVIDE